jgi:O-succinylbenzoate synthase
LDYRLYRRPFRQPLQTHHGIWRERASILVRLTAPSGQLGWGEIAPMPSFGSETLAQAQHLCDAMGPIVTAGDLEAIPDGYPACQFGFETAWQAAVMPAVNQLPELPVCLPICGLLPTGRDALTSWRSLWESGYRTFKWKIGVADERQELGWLEQLCQDLPPDTTLRLDANGGLTLATARAWLRVCEALNIEFVEQPLPPDRLADIQHLAEQFSTPIALDESVAQLVDLERCYRQGWRGILVVKAAIAGSPTRLLRLCQEYQLDTAFSSVLETSIGQQAALRLAIAAGTRRAVGFGVNHWFHPQPPNWLDELWQTR